MKTVSSVPKNTLGQVRDIIYMYILYLKIIMYSKDKHHGVTTRSFYTWRSIFTYPPLWGAEINDIASFR